MGVPAPAGARASTSIPPQATFEKGDEPDLDRLSPARRRHLGTPAAYTLRVSQDVLKVAIWSFFAERLLQSAVVGWGQSGRVRPLEQLGGALIECEASSSRWAETRALLRGIRMGRDTVYFNTERASAEMFTKVDSIELRHRPPSPPRTVGRQDVEQALVQDETEDFLGEHEDEETMVFTEYAAPAFAHIRGLYGMKSSDYRKSFSPGSGLISHASNSKSPQSFMFSEDGRYLLKTASPSELESMLQLLPSYAEHVSRRRGSLITRFYGVYRVSNPRTSRATAYVISSNVFATEKRLHERYDLKGSVVGRRASGTIKHTTNRPKMHKKLCQSQFHTAELEARVLKDLDLVDGAAGADKIRLAAGCKKQVMAELAADTEFLADAGVMDYSLLIGVYPGREPGVVYYLGIIDVLQRYTLRKILERGAKGVVYNRHDISAVPPEEYRERFLRFLDGVLE